jgi:hypothetical protein
MSLARSALGIECENMPCETSVICCFFYFAPFLYRLILNDSSRSRPCPYYEIFAAELSIFVEGILFIFFKLMIESKNIELFCNQF